MSAGVRRSYFNAKRYVLRDCVLDNGCEVPLLGAVRSIHTPNSGTEVTNLQNLQKDGKYVAAGRKGFIPIPGGYEMIGKMPYMKRMKKPVSEKVSRSQPSKQIKGHILIWVYGNGDEKAKPNAFPINEDTSRNWNLILDRMSENIKLPFGRIRKLYDFGGKLVDSVDSLEDNGKYVAAPANESFRPVDLNATKSRRARRKLSDNVTDQTVDTIHSPGLKVRVPKPVKLQESLSKEDDSLVDEEGQRDSPKSRRRSRSESISRRGSEPFPNFRFGRRKSRRSVDDPLPENPIGRLSLADEEESDSRRSSNFSADLPQLSPPDHLYELPGNYAFGTPGSAQKANMAATLSAYNTHFEDGDSDLDSGRSSLLLSDESRPDSVFRAKQKSRPSTTMSVDLDADHGGIFRAKSRSEFIGSTITVLEDSHTKIDMPIDLIEAKEVAEEVY